MPRSALLHAALRVALALTVVCALPGIPTAWAASGNAKAAAALALRAGKAFEAGDMKGAADLYRQAHNLDAGEASYLYAAGRAAHAAQDWAHAVADYEAFLASPGADSARVTKAKAFLAEVRVAQAEQKSADAVEVAKRGDKLLAVSLYLEAWRLAPDRPEPLLQAAILERQAQNKPAAIGHLRTYLEKAPAHAPSRGTAEALLRELETARDMVSDDDAPKPVPQPVVTPVEPKPSPVVVTPQPQPVVPAESPVGVAKPAPKVAGKSHAVAWTAVGVGGALVVTAAILGGLAGSAQSSLHEKLLPNGKYDSRLISLDDAASQANAINTKYTAAAVLGGVGVIGAGVGLVMLLNDNTTKVSVLPTSNGLSLAGRF